MLLTTLTSFKLRLLAVPSATNELTVPLLTPKATVGGPRVSCLALESCARVLARVQSVSGDETADALGELSHNGSARALRCASHVVRTVKGVPRRYHLPSDPTGYFSGVAAKTPGLLSTTPMKV